MDKRLHALGVNVLPDDNQIDDLCHHRADGDVHLRPLVAVVLCGLGFGSKPARLHHLMQAPEERQRTHIIPHVIKRCVVDDLLDDGGGHLHALQLVLAGAASPFSLRVPLTT